MFSAPYLVFYSDILDRCWSLDVRFTSHSCLSTTRLSYYLSVQGYVRIIAHVCASLRPQPTCSTILRCDQSNPFLCQSSHPSDLGRHLLVSCSRITARLWCRCQRPSEWLDFEGRRGQLQYLDFCNRTYSCICVQIHEIQPSFHNTTHLPPIITKRNTPPSLLSTKLTRAHLLRSVNNTKDRHVRGFPRNAIVSLVLSKCVKSWGTSSRSQDWRGDVG